MKALGAGRARTQLHFATDRKGGSFQAHGQPQSDAANAGNAAGQLWAVYGRLSVGKGFVRLLRLLVGAAMYPTCRCGLSCAAGHNAIRAAQVPIVSSHSRCTAHWVFLVAYPVPFL